MDAGKTRFSGKKVRYRYPDGEPSEVPATWFQGRSMEKIQSVKRLFAARPKEKMIIALFPSHS